MANIPLEFTTMDIVKNDTLHLAYRFDILDKVERVDSKIDIDQDIPIKAIQLNLSGKTSNPSISVSIDGKTHLFTLQCAYITDNYPHLKDAVTDCAFVIEGYSIQNVKKERVLLFLPMTKTVETNNIFYPLEQTLVNKTPLNGLTFDDYIPNKQLETDAYTYYSHTDNNGVFFHVLFFQSSPLQYTTALLIPRNDKGYVSDYKVTTYQTATLAKMPESMNVPFEDNIYIDCVPVNYEKKKVKRYMDFAKNAGNMYVKMLTYLVYVIILTLVVYGIYYIYIYSSSSKSSKSPTSGAPAPKP
jgi:hypothetical protein